MKNILITLGILILSSACGSKKDNTKEQPKMQSSVPNYIKVSKDYVEIDFPTIQDPVKHSVSVDSILINLPDPIAPGKPLLSIQDSLLLIATTKSEKAYIVNLNSMRVIKEYRLRPAISEAQNPEGIPCDCALNLTMDLEGLDFYTDNNIIIQINLKLLIINPSGKVMDSIPLRDPKFIYANLYETPVDYNPLTNKLYVYKYCYDCKPGSPDYYSHPFEASIDITSKKISDENLKYPEIYNLFGITAMEQVNRTSYQNFQYFTFFPDHRIYKYNILNKAINVYGGNSAHATGKIWTTSKLETDFDKMLERSAGNDLYFQLVYDDINKRYYRLFVHPDKYDENLGRIKFDYYIQIFNKNFSLEDEIKFEKGFGSFYFSYGGKLYSVAIKKEGIMFYSYAFK
jgi:hypothetical protein